MEDEIKDLYDMLHNSVKLMNRDLSDDEINNFICHCVREGIITEAKKYEEADPVSTERKVISIASGNMYEGAPITVGLCNDGTVWDLHSGEWMKVQDIPQE